MDRNENHRKKILTLIQDVQEQSAASDGKCYPVIGSLFTHLIVKIEKTRLLKYSTLNTGNNNINTIYC